MRNGVPHRGKLPGQPGRVTRLAGVSFLHVNAEGGVTRLAGVMSIRAFAFLNCAKAKARQNNMAANHYKSGELSRRFHLQNVEK